MNSSSQSGISPSARSAVLQVFESTWNEYTTWHAEDCRKALTRISRPVRRSHLFSDYLSALALQPPLSQPSAEQHLFRIEEYDADGIQVAVCTVAGEYSEPGPIIQPHPAYESCTPISRNTMTGDDPDYLPFLPFSDDPVYNFGYDNEQHNFFSWQQRTLHPDMQVIVFETCQDLIIKQGMLPADIDNTKILPLTVEKIQELQAQRDFPKWKVHTGSRQISRKKETSPRETLQYMLERFCNSLNCVTSFCPTHLKTRLPAPVPPKLDPSKLGDLLVAPCGKDCFMYPGDSVSTVWLPMDAERLDMTLDYAPDALSCDLAVICRKPCREVHRQRKAYKSSMPPSERTKHALTNIRINMLDANGQRMATALVMLNHNVHAFLPVHLAAHAADAPRPVLVGGRVVHALGPRRCAGRVSVPVFARLLSATQSSAFHVKQRVGYLTGTRNYMFTADPNSDLCKNVSIQRGIFKYFEVRESQWGLGLFLLEPCDKHDFIAEYVGELIFNPTVRSRAGVSTHRGRSYIFDLNRRIAIDSSSAGNETRYINHSENANCDTAVFLVNGEHRIGVYAAREIEAGEELFIVYGEKFFRDAIVE